MKEIYFILHHWRENERKFIEVYKGLIYTDYKKIMELCIELNASADYWEFYEVEKGNLIE